MKSPLISICIPTYNRVNYLPKLFDSIIAQSFKDYEIIITDNSADDSVKKMAENYSDKLPIHYHKNIPAVSMAENWNINITKAKGKWIKMIHDDDWFSGSDSLSEFASAITPGLTFIASGFNVFHETTNTYKRQILSKVVFDGFCKHPHSLFAGNTIGPPSAVMIKRQDLRYDKRLKWLIDIDYYIPTLSNGQGKYIDKALVNISDNITQATKDYHKNKVVELTEAIILYDKYKKTLTNTVLLYDAWWRLIRNLEIRDRKDIPDISVAVPGFLYTIIDQQKLIPSTLLKVGVFSKTFMVLSYMTNTKR